jgi:Arc/MetJ family transcription regulator
MRTNIVLDDDLVDQARKLSGIRTKREVIREALRTFIQIQEQSRIKSLRGKLHWEGDINELRENRINDRG